MRASTAWACVTVLAAAALQSAYAAACDASTCSGTCDGSRCLCPPGAGGQSCQLTLQSLYFEHAPEVYNLGHKRKLDLQGWNMYPRLYSQLLKQANAQLVVEVGVWKGASSINFAQWLKARGHGVVVAVDTWLGALEFWERDTPGNTLMPEKDLSWRHGYPSVYYTFLSNVLHKKVQDYVIPFPVPSRLAADYLARRNILADFIHVDGGHTYQDAKEDIALWWRILRPGGIMIGDDYTYWPGVKQAVDEFVKEQGLTLKRYKIKWWVQKPPTKTD